MSYCLDQLLPRVSLEQCIAGDAADAKRDTATRAPMTRATHSEPDMLLPPGKTCGDCVHFTRCNAIFGHIAADEVCDWAPSRFQAKATA